MKLPFSFASRLIFRLVLPGGLLALALWPAIQVVTRALGINLLPEVYFSVAVFAFGWAVVLLDMPIYMLFEGRRFWPRWLWEQGVMREDKRLKKLAAKAERLRQEAKKFADEGEELDREAEGLEAEGKRSEAEAKRSAADVKRLKLHYSKMNENESHVVTATFPLRETDTAASALHVKNGLMEHKAVYPTRLGNIITEYESYPKHKYNMDGIFYWYRIWLKLPKEIRDELDERQALADGAIYVSFTFIIASILMFSYSLIELLYRQIVMLFFSLYLLNDIDISFWVLYRLMDSILPVADHILLLNWQLCLFISLCCLTAAYTVYRLSLYVQTDYGNYFKATFDCFRTTVEIKPVLAALADALCSEDRRVSTDDLGVSTDGKAYMNAWRFLRWHRVRLPGEKTNRSIADAKAHLDREKKRFARLGQNI